MSRRTLPGCSVAERSLRETSFLRFPATPSGTIRRRVSKFLKRRRPTGFPHEPGVNDRTLDRHAADAEKSTDFLIGELRIGRPQVGDLVEQPDVDRWFENVKRF